LILAMGVAAAPTTALANACKDLDEGACEHAPACTWVDPYKRLDEVKVPGFCRPTKPQPATPDGD
jgi:hypothetical protein